MIDYETVDWSEDEWFAKHHANRLSPEFKVWWVSFYGVPDDYTDRHEYWVRCAFAWTGWHMSRVYV